MIDGISHRRRLDQENHFPIFQLGRRLLAVGTMDPDSFWNPAGKRDACLDHVFPSDIERVIHHDRDSIALRVQPGSDRLAGAGQHAGELVGRDIVVIPGVLIGARSRRAGGKVVEMPREFQRPGVVQSLLGIRPPAHPFGRDRGFFCSVGEQLILEDHALVVSLRRQRSGGVINQLQVAFVLWHARGHIGLYVVEHLIRSRLDHVDRPFTYAHLWPLRFRAWLILLTEPARRRQYRLALINDGFQQSDRRLPCGAADVSRADVVIVGEDAGDLTIQIDTLDPILFLPLAAALSVRWSIAVQEGGSWLRSV